MKEIAVTPELARQHGLSPEEYGRIRSILGGGGGPRRQDQCEDHGETSESE